MAGQTVPQSLSRRRPPPTGDEETTALLRLGEFEGATCLSVAEARALLKVVQERRKEPDKDGNKPPPMPNSDVYTKTRDYLDMFARFLSNQAVNQVAVVSQRLVEEGSITNFERAQLGR